MNTSIVDLLLTEEDFVPKYQIYCDMDGVLTNFNDRFMNLLNKYGKDYYSKDVINKVKSPDDFQELEGKNEFWKFIDQYIGLEFWSEMEWMPQGHLLWDFIAPYSPKILTSPSRDNASRLGKRLWVKENLIPAPEVLFRFGNSKADFANETSILIDDKLSNLEAFTSKGGIAIECKKGDSTSVISQLKQLGF